LPISNQEIGKGIIHWREYFSIENKHSKYHPVISNKYWLIDIRFGNETDVVWRKYASASAESFQQRLVERY
jgi:hypothetical protein